MARVHIDNIISATDKEDYLFPLKMSSTGSSQVGGVIATNAGVYDPPSVILPINQFITIGENAATVPASPANVPTDGPLNKSLDSVWILPIANWKPNSAKPAKYINVM